MQKINLLKQKILNNDGMYENYRLAYCTDGPSELMRLEGLTKNEAEALANLMDWKRPAIKVPAIYEQVRAGKKKASQYPTLCFRQLNKMKSPDIRDYLQTWYYYDLLFTDLWRTLGHFPSFMDPQLGHEGQVKFLRRLARLEPKAKPAVLKLIREFRRA